MGKEQPIARDWYEFERQVAEIYRRLGADVQHQIALAGNQIDVLVIEKTESGTKVRIAVECKSYSKPVGVVTINAFAGVVILLKQRNLIDKAVVVSREGFTQNARQAAQQHGIELLEFADLRHRLPGEFELPPEPGLVPPQVQHRKLFVLMPFAREFQDVYVLGIREVAEDLNLISERADEIEHNSDIMSVIEAKIKTASIVLADITSLNPNVLYELGFAHGCSKKTIIISRDIGNLPFDLAHYNCVAFDNIIDLREKLNKRLTAMIGMEAQGLH